MTCSRGGTWQRVGTADDFWPVDLNDGGDVVGYNRVDGLNRPWVRLRSEELIPLPFVRDHHTQPTAINNGGLILGSASAEAGRF